MAPERRNLPLFPLNTVLFPGATIPLKIFEERYKEMMKICLDSDARFGVSLIKEGKEVGGAAIPHRIGTIARILSVREATGEKLYITVIGEQRYSIVDFVNTDPYLTATVEIIEEDEPLDVSAKEVGLAQEAAANHMKHALSIQGLWLKTTYAPSDPVKLSYFLAQILQLDIVERQKLLSEDSCKNRLRFCRNSLRKETSRLATKSDIELRLKYSRQ